MIISECCYAIFWRPTTYFLIGITLLINLSCKRAESAIQVTKEERMLFISGNLPAGVKDVEIRIKSSRNQTISSYHDVSSFNPEHPVLSKAGENTDWNIFYPVLDVEPGEMKGIAILDRETNARYSVNGMFHQTLFTIHDTAMVIDPEYLQNWENNIYIQPSGSKMVTFYLSERIKTGRKIDRTYQLLSESWSGDVSIFELPGEKELCKVTINGKINNPDQGRLQELKDNDLDRNRLLTSLIATIEFTMGCQDKSANGETKGGLNLFYDLEAKTYRRPTWIWGWGPSIKLLIEAVNYPEICSVIPADSLLLTAKEIGETSLKFQETDPSSPAYGIITSRWSENKGTLEENFGFEQYYSIADAQFLAGWGWIPLYEATGDDRYLIGVRLLTEVTGRLTRQFEIIPMDYMVRAGNWKDYALNEQGFGTEGINELNKVDPNPAYIEIGDAYMKMLFAKFETPEGIWNRMYWIEKQEPVPPAYHTRGVGWAMEGLLATYELTGNKEYLEKAEKMAGHLMNDQLPDGSWSYSFRSKDTTEISEKGTALWSLLFYKLYHCTKDTGHLETARKSLKWCLDNQYDGPDMHAHGGLTGLSRQSGVIYRPWFPMACSYTSGFFGLAVMEELKIQNTE